MGKANVFGPSSGHLGANALIFEQFVDFADTDTWPVYSEVFPMEHFDGYGLQLVSGGARSIEMLNGDHVVALTQTFTFKAGHFTQNDEGASFTLAGSVDGNDGTYVIASVVNAFTVTTVGAPVADENFDPDVVTVDLVQSSPHGNWDFRISNSYSPGSATQTPTDGSPWTPIGSQFSPAIAAVTQQYVKDTANSANQYCQAAPLVCSAIQLRFTPTSGAGPITAWGQAKGNR